MSDLKDLTLWTLWESPYELRMSVPIKVTWDEWFDQTLSKWMESMRFEWIEVNRTIRDEMSELKDLTLWTLWQDPYGQNKVSLWKWLEMSDLIKPYQNDQIQWEMNELKWNEWNEVKWVIWRKWARTTLWEWSYGRLRVSLWKWLEWKWKWMSLSKWMESMRNEWIEWIEVKWVNGWKWLGTTLWEWSYGQLRVSLSKWLEWTLWECPYQNE